jgi:tungstate transport system permease protein
MDPFVSAILISLSVSIAATMLCVAVGLPVSCFLAAAEFHGKNAVLNVLNTLLSLPTVVVGLLVYSFLCRGSILGGLGLLFTPWAMVIGQFVLALPIIVTFSHAALAGVDPTARETAATLGAGPVTAMATLLAEARFGIGAAVAATFGRLIGEVGVSMMLGGNIAGYTRTMTTTIALETSKGEFTLGLKLGCVLLVLALAVNMLLQFLRGRANG